MPEGVGYGGEVGSTTNKKVITKKAVPQKRYSTADPPIHPETPAPTGIPSRPRDNSPEAIREFQKQVAESGADEATQRDILKAAKVPLPGVGISAPSPKAKRAGELQRAGPAGEETRRKEDAMKAGGFSPAEINAFKSMEEERLLRKKRKEPVFETEQPGP